MLMEIGEEEDQKSGGGCNGEWFMVDGCKWRGCESSSFVEVEDLNGRPHIIGREGKENDEEPLLVFSKVFNIFE